MAMMTLPNPGGEGNSEPGTVQLHPRDAAALGLASTRVPSPEGTGSAILCLDLGTRTGWALHDDGQTFSGTSEFRPGRFQGGGMRYLQFRQWLDQIAGRTSLATLQGGVAGFDAVYFEAVRRHIGTDAAHVFGGFLATLTAWCEQRCIPYEGVPVGTIKRHVTGKGNADKAAVIAAVQALGFQPADDNEADALALLRWALDTRFLGGGQ